MTEGRGSVVFFRWKDGPTVMICSDMGEAATTSAGTISGPPWAQKYEGSATSPDGRQFVWQLETTDGRNVKCRVADKEYDLANGCLFLVKTRGGKTEVEQLSRDLSAVQPETESCRSFVRSDPAVSKLLRVRKD
jgi:hypothetical protein